MRALFIVLCVLGALMVAGAWHRDDRRAAYVAKCMADGTAEWQCRAKFDNGRHR